MKRRASAFGFSGCARPNAQIRLALVAALMAVAGLASAESQGTQCPLGHSLAYSIELGLDQARDDLLVPLRFTGPVVGGGGAWTYSKESWCSYVELGLSGSPVWTTAGDPGVLITSHWAGGLWLAAANAGAVRIDFGPSIRSRTHTEFLYSWDDARSYWLSTLTLDLAGRATWLINDRRAVLFRLALPTFGFASRPDAERFEKQEEGITFGGIFWRPGLEAVSWGRHASVEVAGGLAWLWRSPAQLELVARYDYFRDPEPFRRFTLSLVWSQSVTIGRRR